MIRNVLDDPDLLFDAAERHQHRLGTFSGVGAIPNWKPKDSLSA
jgi:hypothetical protein